MRHLLLVILAVIGLVLLQERVPQIHLTDQVNFSYNERIPSFNADTISLLSFGYPRFLSTILWIRFLGQTPINKVPPGQFSWIYHDLSAILDIDPDFYPAAEIGGVYLSVITEDKTGAKLLLEKGVKLFPDRWSMRAYLAYHYQFELNDPSKAAEEYRLASQIPGSPYILGLVAARLVAAKESPQAGIDFLTELLKTTKNPEIRKRFENKIATLKEQQKHE